MSMFHSVSCAVTIPLFSLAMWWIWCWQIPLRVSHLTDTMQLTSPYRTCSKESETCRVQGLQRLECVCTCQGLVRFGAKDPHSRVQGVRDRWTDPIQVNGSIECNESSFGADPIFGVTKTCECDETGLPATQRTAQVRCGLLHSLGAL